MGWRERFGADDERARIAARARALLDAAAARPSPGAPPPGGRPPGGPPPGGPPPASADPVGFGAPSPFPPPRGGWVPPVGVLGDLPAPRPAVAGRARHAADAGPEDVLLPGAVRAVGLVTPPAAVTGPGGAPSLSELLPVEVPRFDPSSPPTAPSWRERIRFEPGRRGLVAVAAVVVVVGSVAGGVLFRGGQSSAVTLAAASGAAAPSDAPVAPVASGVAGRSGASSASSASSAGSAGSATGSSRSTPASPPTASGTVTVDVAGLVVRPGVYTLPAGSRVEDALREAGGARPGTDLTTLNRARVLVDGEQLSVGVPGAPAASAVSGAGGTAGTGGGAGAGAPGGTVNLNTASLADLDTLPGVGPVLAQAILDWRTDHGRFSSVDDLQQVTGIGPARFADLRDLVTV